MQIFGVFVTHLENKLLANISLTKHEKGDTGFHLKLNGRHHKDVCWTSQCGWKMVPVNQMGRPSLNLSRICVFADKDLTANPGGISSATCCS